METYIIQTKNLTKKYDGREVIQNINLHVKPGKFTDYWAETARAKPH